MDIGFVGLAGGSDDVARRLARGGVNVFGFDAGGRAAALADEKILTAMPTAVALARALSAPRVVWINVAPGVDTELAIQEVWPELAAGDVIVDAAAARYQDAPRRAAALVTARIHFVDCALAPVADDPAHGHVLVFGGSPAAAQVLAPFARILAPDPERGWLHCGPPGSGHFVRMINEAMEQGVAAPVLSVALLRQSGRASRDARGERLLAAIDESCGGTSVPTKDPIK